MLLRCFDTANEFIRVTLLLPPSTILMISDAHFAAARRQLQMHAQCYRAMFISALFISYYSLMH